MGSATPQELINFPSDNFYLLFAKLVGQAMCQIDLEFDHVITTTQPQGAFLGGGRKFQRNPLLHNLLS